ncbi:MAG: hypothetical protein A3G49_02425 [Candidatus Sungbacteria bacterium RIFCSPLOWO2_12_FULL_41_11]|uniref:Polymerase beta nucleotidyltransferase domain-containing protein n=1 Tax=Candidatus Sungbacteria bacterium RIFCSPLOWO2_12_FULL_41_11 TaxID=1802286 RepID=A0A1G2LNJ6_9BACT|nr:MAG: hypothetical protein UV01_C0004G0075 [Parcubacteria group bacterium GW2011_GWA2_42_14]OHA13197.1 MAG: hypothetical protein A3G49_02425 [Candidatus Sungbacteria bacterium RIFCSPLOWO2_12_FULL_41_11]
MDKQNGLIRKLKEYFEKRDDVAMAFLFGSRAEDRRHSGSDWDIAVYFKPEVERTEWEEHNREYPEETRVWGDCVDILKTDKVDLLVLNRAPATIADSAIRGVPLVVKDRGLWLEFMLIITSAAEDLREFARDYYEIYMRSKSLTLRDAERLGRIIEFINNQMTLYSVFRELTFGEYEKDLIKRGAAERWVENMVNSTMDISKIVLSSSKKPMPYGYADTIRVALLYLNINDGFWQKFLDWVKLRNALAHEYTDIKWKKIEDFAKTSEPYFQTLVKSAQTFLEREREGV